jgi:uncharacterized protein (DUF433 family)
MLDDILLERITLDSRVMVGKPVIRGTRLTVEYILKLLVSGATFTEILDEYPELTDDDIRPCILFATKTMETTTFLPLKGERKHCPTFSS